MEFRLIQPSDKELAIMHEEILKILSDFGVLFEDDRGRDLLRKAGNWVDEDGRVHLKSPFV